MTPIYPPAVISRVPWPVQCARELYGLSSSWQPLGLEQTKQGWLIRGGIYRTIIERGPRAGETDFRKPEPESFCTVKLSQEDYDAWLLRWEAETGFCHTCRGSSWAFVKWEKIKGSQYAPCPRCAATGKAQPGGGRVAA